MRGAVVSYSTMLQLFIFLCNSTKSYMKCSVFGSRFSQMIATDDKGICPGGAALGGICVTVAIAEGHVLNNICVQSIAAVL